MDFARDHRSFFFSNRLQVCGERAKELTRLHYFLLGFLALRNLTIDTQDTLNIARGIEFWVNTPLEDRESLLTFEFKLSFKGLLCSKHISNHAFYEFGLLLVESCFRRS